MRHELYEAINPNFDMFSAAMDGLPAESEIIPTLEALAPPMPAELQAPRITNRAIAVVLAFGDVTKIPLAVMVSAPAAPAGIRPGGVQPLQ
jgi:hypothetical protein